MIKVVSVENMRLSDAKAIENGISSRDLMFRAGYAAYKNANYTSPIAIVCGSGNNAGDGYVLAYLLKDRAKECKIFLLSDKFSNDGKYYFDKCIEKGIEIEYCSKATDFSSYNTIVDCILGTGYKGNILGLVREIIDKINNSKAYKVSIDINSGLNGDSGMAEVGIVSDLTISIGDYKSGHFLNKAKDFIKEKINCDIGIPLQAPPYELIQSCDIRHLFIRNNFANKGDFGYVALIGGSFAYSGAIKLSNLACSALRAGAGVATLAVPYSLHQAVLPYLLESTLFLLSDSKGEIIFNKDEIDLLLKKTKAIAIGMGIGQSAEVGKLLAYILTVYEGRVIIDADGLNMLALMDKQILVNTKAKVILTPHLKEFERLSGKSRAEINDNPIGAALDFAAKHNIILLLKGTTTIITDGSKVYLSNEGTSGMATAGSGDVLSGILVGMCGYLKSGDLLLGTASAAYINGLAGRIAEEQIGKVSMLASDSVNSIGKAINSVLQKDD